MAFHFALCDRHSDDAISIANGLCEVVTSFTGGDCNSKKARFLTSHRLLEVGTKRVMIANERTGLFMIARCDRQAVPVKDVQ